MVAGQIVLKYSKSWLGLRIYQVLDIVNLVHIKLITLLHSNYCTQLFRIWAKLFIPLPPLHPTEFFQTPQIFPKCHRFFPNITDLIQKPQIWYKHLARVKLWGFNCIHASAERRNLEFGQIPNSAPPQKHVCSNIGTLINNKCWNNLNNLKCVWYIVTGTFFIWSGYF